jgi:hypothetical protein
MSKNYVTLRRIIIERQAASRRLGKEIRRATGLARHALRLEKRSYGDTTRSILLAYAMLRGVPYETVERRVVRAPSASAIADVVCQHEVKEDAVEEVKRWLKSSSS